MFIDKLLTKLADKYSITSTIISEVCTQSSAILIDVLKTKYNLFEHFKGFRDYMLLGRGDFYAHIIFELEYDFILKKYIFLPEYIIIFILFKS